MTKPAPVRWSRGRWWMVIGFLFLIQIGVLLLISERLSDAPPQNKKTRFRLLTTVIDDHQIFSELLATDPSVFVMANRHGFSGGAWLRMPSHNYEPSDWADSDRWLDVDVEQLGTVFTNLLRSTDGGSFKIAEKIPPAFLIEEPIQRAPTASRFTLGRTLMRRRLIEPPALPSFALNDVLKESVVQVGVDGRGNVVSARLLAKCGWAPADQAALSISRNLSFKPMNSGDEAKRLVWGNISYQWETTPAPTNVVSEFE